jgi:hypothetical protein
MDLTNIKPEELKCKGTLSILRHKIEPDKHFGARCKYCGKTVHQIRKDERARRLRRG